jgi:hypothetical protein
MFALSPAGNEGPLVSVTGTGAGVGVFFFLTDGIVLLFFLKMNPSYFLAIEVKNFKKKAE